MLQVVTGVTPTLVVATSLALISASATRASMEMDTLVLVGKQFLCCPNVRATSGAQSASETCVLPTILACAHQTSVPHCPCLQTLMSVL